MKKFALIGVGGYIAPRHLKAIKETGNTLIAALDKNDSVGILDSYFPDAAFFTEFERFDRYLEKLRHEKGQRIDYVTVCSPNYLHDAHIRFALRIGADAICEKPLVLNPWNVSALIKSEQETGQKINTIMQLRLHNSIKELKAKVDSSPKDKMFYVDLTYITSRGKWYMVSWKGDMSKSGGITNNIGIHFFDILCWIFGRAKKNVVHLFEKRRASGVLDLERAKVRWFLSVEKKDLPFEPEPGQPCTYRSISIDGEEMEFSGGFSSLHTESYKDILAGKGFRPQDVLSSIEIASEIRDTPAIGVQGDCHPLLAEK